jgi:hypothetical protein
VQGPEQPMEHDFQTFQPSLGILPPAQRALWERLREVTRMGFVLYGGTAVALRLGHRQSVDFDFFTERAFVHAEVLGKFPSPPAPMVLQEAPGTLTLQVEAPADSPAPGSPDPGRPDPVRPDPVKLSFFTVGTGRIGVPEWTGDGAILVASSLDLMAHKLKVLLQRLEKKDYLDLHALLAGGGSLEAGLAGARALFGRAFQPAEALKALGYFKGGDLHELPGSVREDLIRAAAGVRHLPDPPAVLPGLGGSPA